MFLIVYPQFVSILLTSSRHPPDFSFCNHLKYALIILNYRSLQADVVCLDGEGEENGGGVSKFAGGLGGEIFAGITAREGFANGSVAREIITQ